MPLMLLDYGKPDPFGEIIGRPRHLAWPVNVYRVTLPKVSEDDEKLNAFERVILKLIHAGGTYDEKLLAQETCLPEDLMRCILLRLQDKGFIDEYNRIIQHQRSQWSSNDNDQPVFVTACMFRELATGKILPYLHILDDSNPLKKKEGEERFFRRIRWDDAHRKRTPTPRDVISALRKMKKRAMAFGSETRSPSVQQITIVSNAELYYLDCPIAIQRSDGEFRIADPFVIGYSLVLESAFNRLLEMDSSLGDWLKNWKRSLSSPRQDKHAPDQREPYDNDSNLARYPNLIFNLRLGRYRKFRSIEQIYSALEWALFYVCAQRRYPPIVQQLKLTNQSEHPALFQKAAKALSLQLPEGGLFPVREGKLNDFLAGKAELGTVLSLSLLMAEADPFHPLHRLASTYPDFILRLLKIKNERDELAHGAGRQRARDNELPEDAFMRDIVATLLPSIRFIDSPRANVDDEAITDSLLDARASIQNEFGFSLFNHLGTDLQDRLIAAERFWLSCEEGDDALAFVCDVYAALQSAFSQFLTRSLPPDIRDSEYIAAAQANAQQSGLGELPECLLTVKRSAIRETLQGNDQTLQSCVVTFLLTADAETLNAIARMQPSFIDDVARVIDRRGHGNKPLLLPKDEIRILRKAAYSTLKILLEV